MKVSLFGFYQIMFTLLYNYLKSSGQKQFTIIGTIFLDVSSFYVNLVPKLEVKVSTKMITTGFSWSLLAISINRYIIITSFSYQLRLFIGSAFAGVNK